MEAGTLRFVNVLECAEHVARTWRKVGGIGIRELAECYQEDFGTLTLCQNLFQWQVDELYELPLFLLLHY